MSDKARLYELLHELEERKRTQRMRFMFPEEGKLSRHNYGKHMEFFRATSKYREVWFMAGNRVGKTEAGCFAATCFLLGEYPHWWEGKRFEKQTIRVWAAGTSGVKTRDTLQEKLLGPAHAIGTGMIPKDRIIGTPTAKAGVPDGKDTVRVKNAFGGVSELKFKSFDQGRAAFEGTEVDVIILDEECPVEVREECIVRTMTTGGIVLLTFTALQGITELISNTFPEGIITPGEVGNKYIVNASWEDAPHLSDADIEAIVSALPPHIAMNRRTGLPTIGEGLIYPVAEDSYVVEPFEIPENFKHVYGFDTGWRKTAAVFAAYDPSSQVKYIYAVHLMGEQLPAVHASAIKKYGDMVGIVDYAARGRGADGRRVFDDYKAEGLELVNAVKSVDAGLIKCYQALVQGKTKVFKTCMPFLHEIRQYRRDENGKVVKVNDHVMDAWRYLEMTGDQHARACFAKKDADSAAHNYYIIGRRGSWMGA